jgi:aryl-alcohol dehydrogenase-like predicted oxidoreductase
MTNIKKRRLGKTDMMVSEIGFGLWAAGGDAWGPTDDQTILDTIDEALAAGVNFYDTADVYGMGHSEELLARAMHGRRDQFIVATKIGWIDYDELRDRTAYDTVDKLVAGVENNLRRLDTDYIDVLQSHIDHREATMEVFLEGFQKLERDGKIRAYGVSTSDFEYLQAFNQDGRCSTLQIDYSILHRMPEADILPYCQAQDIGVIIRGALAMGILAGKFTANSTFAEGDFRNNWINNADERKVFLNDLKLVEKLRVLEDGRSLAQAALQFTLAHLAVSTVIPGIKNQRQLEANLGASSAPSLSAAEMRQIDAVVPAKGGRKIWPA